ncbi:hypothetical protein MLIT_41600 [Mycolicibacterium litorale]|uniref:Tetratricopeptide repeat protein n=1 Tax=Mycolicibacterium litorale TaxID=758802 RepID=A0AAD1MWA4_9MYCO|nr:hypothetical protein MLIT_41600 [Mycolicibacterium litorale]
MVAVASFLVALISGLANLVRTLSDNNRTDAQLFSAIGWLLAAAVALVFATAVVINASRRDRLTQIHALRVAPVRISTVDPVDLGVAAPTPGYRLLAANYVRRKRADTELDRAVAHALSVRSMKWIVAVNGPATVGKSRTLFEGLCRHGDLIVVAPRNNAALQKILDPGEARLELEGPAVLWLDPFEIFANDIVSGDLRRWRESGPGRIVALAYGGNTSLGIDVTQGLSDHVCRVLVDRTTAEEVEVLADKIAPDQLGEVHKHGLAAYLVAGHDIEKKLIHRAHPGELGENLPGAAIVEAAIDWHRCGRIDAISRQDLRDLWTCYTPSSPHLEKNFQDALDWALKPVAGSISLLHDATDGDDQRYRAYPYAVHLRTASLSTEPPDEVWSRALCHGSPPQALLVAGAALKYGRTDDAVTALTQAAMLSEGLPTDYAIYAWAQVAAIHSAGDNHDDAVDACDRLISLIRSDRDTSTTRLGVLANALATRAYHLLTGAPGHPDRRAEALACYDLLIDLYFENADRGGAGALRLAAALAVIHKVEATAGRDESFRYDKLPDALELWDKLITDYFADPGLNQGSSVPGGTSSEAWAELRRLVATALNQKSDALTALADVGGAVSVEWANEGYERVVAVFGSDADRDVRNQVEHAVLRLASSYIAQHRRSQEAMEVIASALAVYERWIAQHPLGESHESAVALYGKGAILAYSRWGREQSRTYYQEVVERFRDSQDPFVRSVVATALLNDADICVSSGLPEIARSNYEQIISDYADDLNPRTRAAVDAAAAGLKSLG